MLLRYLTRWMVVLGAAALLTALGSACGAAEEPTPTPTSAPRPTPTTAAVVAPAPTPTTAPVVAVPTVVPTATALPKPPAAKRGGTMRFALQTDSRSTSPLRATASELSHIEGIYGYLVGMAPDQSFVAQLARSWEIAADGKTLTLRLQSGVKFHDGSDFNAQAVKLFLDQVRDPKWNALGVAFLKPISSVEAVDDLTVRINFSVPDVVVLTRLSTREGMIPSAKAMASITPETLPEYSRNPVGAGPFKFVEWRSDSHIKWERWDKSFPAAQGLPYLDGVVGRFITDGAVALANFRAGELDVFNPTAAQIKLLRGQKGVQLYESWDSHYYYLHFNRTMAPLGDVRVRKAISHAIDRQTLVEVAQEGQGVPIYNNVSPYWGWLYDPKYVKYGYDVNEAKRLLTEAGYPNGFKYPGPVVWYTEERGIPEATAIKDMLGKVGITFDLLQLRATQAYNGHFLDHKYPMIILGISCAEDPDRCFREHFYSSSPQFTQGPVVPGLDDLIDKQRQTLNFEDRKKLLQQTRDVIVENMLDVFTYAHKNSMAYRDFVKDYEPSPGAQGYHRWWKVWLDK